MSGHSPTRAVSELEIPLERDVFTRLLIRELSGILPERRGTRRGVGVYQRGRPENG